MQPKILFREWVVISLVVGALASIGVISWSSRVKSEESLAIFEKMEKVKKNCASSPLKKKREQGKEKSSNPQGEKPSPLG